jgi:hypothetical protein
LTKILLDDHRQVPSTELVLVDGWMDGWMDGWIDGWMDGWMDGGKTLFMDCLAQSKK